MTTYMSPGVYIREVPSGPQPIAAVSASVLAIVGTAARGPVLDPQRVTGWGDFVDRFGGPVPGSFTAEAVAGYFENGGQAAYIVRADPSSTSRWMVRDALGNDVFEIEASSPGGWSADMSVSVTPSTLGGLARTWTSPVQDINGSVVSVRSAAGLRVGDTLNNGTATRQVEAITGNDVTVESAPPGSWADATLFIEQTGMTLNLASANGIEVGDLLMVERPGADVAFAALTALDVQADGGATATVGASINADGGATAARTANYDGTLSLPGLDAVTPAQLDLTGVELATADLLQGYSLQLSDGQVARWDGANYVLPGNRQMAVGPVKVQGPIRVTLFQETVDLTNPSTAELARQYSWVPDGSRMSLSGGGGAAAVIDKQGTGFVVDSGDLNATFDTISFDPNGSTSALVTAARQPLIGDSITFNAAVTVDAVTSLGGTRYQLTLSAAPNPGSTAERSGLAVAFQQTRIVPLRFGLTVSDGALVETFDNLAVAEGHSRSHNRDGLVNESSTLITVGPRLTTGDLTANSVPNVVEDIAAGSSEVATAQDLIEGVAQLEREAEPAILICPDALTFEDSALQSSVFGALISHAEQFRRFAVIDTPRLSNDQDLVDWRLENVNSIYAAAYAPHVKILNLDGDAPERFRTVPPSGAIAGVFARTDASRGVHKAPANEGVRGIVDLDEQYTQRRQDLLNPNGVNVIRSFPGRGRRIWGARNATTDTTWRYVNVRRLFNVIENSIEQGTQWVVFEPNTASTWLRVRVSVENFLNGLWSAGALAGNSPDEAYRVRVGLGETMTEAQIELGLVIVQVAVAAARPAEFVVFEFSHKRLSE